MPGVQNMTTYSEQFDNAIWTKILCSVSTNTVANPVNGAIDADSIIEGSTNNYHYWGRNITGDLENLFTASIYVKANGRNFLVLQIAGGTSLTLCFSLVDGSITGTPGVGYKAESVGNGWWRLSITTTGITNFQFYLSSTASINPTYQGDGVSGVYAWGAQVVRANWAGPYVKTEAAAVNTGAIRSIVT